ncbi:cytochrome c [Myxococcota bacterium]|nr:cytochrome c [Myxococcota bacterium]
MKLALPFAALIALGGCGGSTDGTGSSTAPPTPVAPAASPAAEAPSPDGPADLAIPDVSSLPTDAASLARGKSVFDGKGCGACHAFGSKLVGPDLTGLKERRSTPWLARMIRHPEQMTKRDPVAKDLFRTHMVQMTDQRIDDEDLKLLLAYLLERKEG